MQALWRLAIWGGIANLALFVAVIAGYSNAGSQRQTLRPPPAKVPRAKGQSSREPPSGKPQPSRARVRRRRGAWRKRCAISPPIGIGACPHRRLERISMASPGPSSVTGPPVRRNRHRKSHRKARLIFDAKSAAARDHRHRPGRAAGTNGVPVTVTQSVRPAPAHQPVPRGSLAGGARCRPSCHGVRFQSGTRDSAAGPFRQRPNWCRCRWRHH